MVFLRKLAIVLGLLLCISALSGCTKQDWKDLFDIGKSWAVEHEVLDDNGSPNYWNIATRSFGGSTGDPQADAVIDAGITVKNFQKAEDLSKEGFQARDVSKVSKAISMRPGEYRYYNQRGALNFFTSKYKDSEKDFDEADKLALKYGKDAQIRNLTYRSHAIGAEYSYLQSKNQMYQEGKIKYYKTLIETYDQLYVYTSNHEYEKASNDLKDLMKVEQEQQ